MPTPTAVLTDATTGLTVNIYAVEENGGLKITYEKVGSVGGDLNGLFIDWDNNGGPLTSVGTKSNNMNGAGDGWDKGYVLGSVGGNDADHTYGTVFIEGKTLYDLYGSELGMRATSVGYYREDSSKMTCVVEKPPGEEPPKDHFPDFKKVYGHDISNVVFYFDTPAGYPGDTKPGTKDGGPDGYFTVKIDNYPTSGADDLDTDYAALLDYIQTKHPDLDLDTLAGVAIKGGQEQHFFAIDNNTGANDANVPTGNFIVNNDIDKTYDYGLIFV